MVSYKIQLQATGFNTKITLRIYVKFRATDKYKS